MKKVSLKDLDSTWQDLISKAEKTKENSYSPYSYFKVGASILTNSGNIYSGANIENNAYGESICAERAAAIKAASGGERKFKRLVIITDSDKIMPPCGNCRQFLLEFKPKKAEDLKILIASSDKSRLALSDLAELYPKPFRFSP